MELVRYDYSHDAVALVGWLALPEGEGPHPAVMVMYDARGQGEQVRERARRLAALGYVAHVTDIYGDGRVHAMSSQCVDDLNRIHATPDVLRERVLINYRALAARPEVDASRIAAIGFCFGGECVLELARSGADVKAVVSYHGLLTTAKPAEPGAVKAHIAVYTGAKDPYAPLEHVDVLVAEMAAAGAVLDVTVFGNALHAFTDKDEGSHDVPGTAYDAVADSVSWAGTIALLQEKLS
jgi:Dienelactone hydrolase and related enzymes